MHDNSKMLTRAVIISALVYHLYFCLPVTNFLCSHAKNNVLPRVANAVISVVYLLLIAGLVI